MRCTRSPGSKATFPTTFEPTSIVALLILGAVGTGLVWALYLGLIGRVGAVRASIAGYLIPVVALLLGVIVLDERVHVAQAAGVFVALGGGYILSKGRKATAPPPEPTREELQQAARTAATSRLPQTAYALPQIVVNLDGSCTTVERQTTGASSA